MTSRKVKVLKVSHTKQQVYVVFDDGLDDWDRVRVYSYEQLATMKQY